jgi:hypothetical protein
MLQDFIAFLVYLNYKFNKLTHVNLIYYYFNIFLKLILKPFYVNFFYMIGKHEN